VSRTTQVTKGFIAPVEVQNENVEGATTPIKQRTRLPSRVQRSIIRISPTIVPPLDSSSSLPPQHMESVFDFGLDEDTPMDEAIHPSIPPTPTSSSDDIMTMAKALNFLKRKDAIISSL